MDINWSPFLIIIGGLVLLAGDCMVFVGTLTYLAGKFFLFSKRKTFFAMGIGSAVLFFFLGIYRDVAFSSQAGYLTLYLFMPAYFLLPIIVLACYYFSNRGKPKSEVVMYFLGIMSLISVALMFMFIPVFCQMLGPSLGRH